MREVHHKEDLRDAYDRAKSEAKAAFGDDDVYVEKLIVEPKHIEVQILGDEHGNVVHLHDGIIKVSGKEGEGTTFTVRIPLNHVKRRDKK